MLDSMSSSSDSITAILPAPPSFDPFLDLSFPLSFLAGDKAAGLEATAGVGSGDAPLDFLSFFSFFSSPPPPFLSDLAALRAARSWIARAEDGGEGGRGERC